ncbi:MAG: ATP-dependent protease ATPase subunit HslU [Bacteroidota bacterium]
MSTQNDKLTPHKLVKELSKYIIGQEAAKKSIAIALRNRWRKRHADEAIRDEIYPTNILMKGPTGTGKTEIARRIAQIAQIPFVKVDATQYTEVGYVGKNVESMIYTLTDKAMQIVKGEKREALKQKTKKIVDQIILDILIPPLRNKKGEKGKEEVLLNENTRKRFWEKLINGELEDRNIDIHIKEASNIGLIGGGMMDEKMFFSFKNLISRLTPTKSKKKKVTVREARKILTEEQLDKMTDSHHLAEEAIARAEMGIIFIDEIDKIVSSTRRNSGGPDVSRSGVQRNLLPIVEGTPVATNIGIVKTDHILFIAAGAFHNSKPTDLMPELQGRFPSRVEMQSLKEEDYYSILKEPKTALIEQQKALLAAEKVTLNFTEEAIKTMAKIAFLLNTEKENIGARRLRAVMAQVLKEVAFEVPEKIQPNTTVNIDKNFVEQRLEKVMQEHDSNHYVI